MITGDHIDEAHQHILDADVRYRLALDTASI